MLVLFFAFWLILCGRVTVELLLIGVALTAMMYFFVWACFGYTWRSEVKVLKLIPLAALYLMVLAKEIVMANIAVLKIVWFKNIPIEPSVVKLKIPFKTDAAKSVLANSISITPGTISATVDGDDFYVHCLNVDMIEGIDESRFVKLLRTMEESL